MTRAIRKFACLLAFSTLVGCDGSTDGPRPPAISFSSSACKKDVAAKMAAMPLLDRIVLDSDAGLDGLRCVAWKRVDGNEIKLDLFNFEGACGATWSGDAAVAADGSLELRIDNP